MDHSSDNEIEEVQAQEIRSQEKEPHSQMLTLPENQNKNNENDDRLDISTMEVLIVDDINIENTDFTESDIVNDLVVENISIPRTPSSSTHKSDVPVTRTAAEKLLNKLRTPRKGKGSLRSYIDNLSEKDEGIITQAIAEFFFACNIPFNVIESKYFINMVTKLRPAYAKKNSK